MTSECFEVYNHANTFDNNIVKDQYYHLVYPNIMLKVSNLWKWWLHLSIEFTRGWWRKKLVLCAFRCIKRLQLKYFVIWVGHFFSNTIRYFRGSRFPQSFILSTVLHWSLPVSCYCNSCLSPVPLRAGVFKTSRWSLMALVRRPSPASLHTDTSRG